MQRRRRFKQSNQRLGFGAEPTLFVDSSSREVGRSNLCGSRAVDRVSPVRKIAGINDRGIAGGGGSNLYNLSVGRPRVTRTQTELFPVETGYLEHRP